MDALLLPAGLAILRQAAAQIQTRDARLRHQVEGEAKLLVVDLQSERSEEIRNLHAEVDHSHAVAEDQEGAQGLSGSNEMSSEIDGDDNFIIVSLAVIGGIIVLFSFFYCCIYQRCKNWRLKGRRIKLH